MTLSSCVPLAIGAAGVAAGYIARDSGVGVVGGNNSSGSGYSSPEYQDTYDSSGYDQPAVY